MNKTLSHVLLALATVSGILLWWFDLGLMVMWVNDTYFLSLAIGIYVLISYVRGFYQPTILPRLAEDCVVFGLLGTVIGFSISLTEIQASGQTLDGLAGAFTAFHTTIVGLIGAWLLRRHALYQGVE